MVYLTNWQEYQDAAEALYAASPNKTRYVIKWKVARDGANKGRGELVLKITDDVTCLKYKTQSSILLNRFEQLNLSLAKRMRNRTAAPPPPPAAHSPAPAAMDVDSERGGTPVPGQSGIASGGVAKKKKKKGKK
ncbi:signal recognition particle, SRP9/SRP14 subunit [Exidia glandulosa HHB12029]|uniref:Signal recognition particle, SRP9/SRP14 subunit n=1 Tax=Exidia glandulosa HHB12029 TaxID=1314781 RepID=A0A165BYI4_EXIGL|nr:signal recognition particle, SRP9/SRP14 subunit [Exidia glandulosa HHB12029]